MRIAFTPRALSQLAAVYEYLSARSPKAAHSVRSSIQATIDRLVHMPMLGKLTDEPGILVLIEPEYLYRVFYHVDGEVVSVIRILHGSQE